MAAATPAPSLEFWDKSPDLFLFTSLTSGSSSIVTATSRIETILRANRIGFRAIDLATDESAKRLWQRRAGAKRKLPALVKEGFVLGDIDQVEEWNEYGELREQVGFTAPPAPAAPAKGGGAKLSIPVLSPLPAGTAAPPNTKANTPALGPQGKDLERDPMRDLAVQAAGIGAARHKGPKALGSQEKGGAAAAAATAASTDGQEGQGDKEQAPAQEQALEGASAKEEAEVVAGEKVQVGAEREQEQEAAVDNVRETTAPGTSGAVDTDDKTTEESLGQDTTGERSLKDNTTTEKSLKENKPTEESLKDDTTAEKSLKDDTNPDKPAAGAPEPLSATNLAAIMTGVEDSSSPVGLARSQSSASATTHHRGSEIVSASQEEIREAEDRNRIAEQEGEEEDETSGAAAGGGAAAATAAAAAAAAAPADKGSDDDDKPAPKPVPTTTEVGPSAGEEGEDVTTVQRAVERLDLGGDAKEQKQAPPSETQAGQQVPMAQGSVATQDKSATKAGDATAASASVED